MPSKIISYKEIYKCPKFKMVHEDVILENGVKAGFDTIRHPGGAAIVPFLPGGKIVLINQFRHALNEYIWEIPAGTLDIGESFMDCAKRELTEETGYKAESWESLCKIISVPGYSDEIIEIFLAWNLEEAIRNPDDDEILKVRITDFAKALEMVTDGRIKDSKTICGLFAAHARLQDNR